MNKRHLIQSALIGVFVNIACPVFAQSGNIPIYEVGMPTNVVPYIMLDEHGKPIGFVADVLKTIGSKQNIDFHFTSMPWSAIYGSLNNGKIDLVSVAISSPERQRLYEESIPYNVATRAVVVKDEALKDLSIDHLLRDDNIRFATIDGNADFHHIVNKIGEGRVKGVATPFLELKSLITGKVEAIYEDKQVMRYYQKKRKGIYIIQDENTPTLNNVFYAQKGNTALINKINQGIKKMIADGSLDALKQKWFGDN